MRKILVIAAAVAMIGATALPASADTTVTNFTLSGGTLTMSVAAGPVTLGGEDTVEAVNTISGNLTEVVVSDLRGGVAGWVVSAGSTTFTNSGLSVSTSVDYNAGVPVETGSSTITVGSGVGLTTSVAAVVSATDVSGNNTATWTPSLDVNMPTGALAGTYTGTVTTSIA